MPSKKHKNKDDDIIVSTIGGQATGVTGSVTLVSYKKKDNTRGCVLLELGGIQGNRDIKTEYIDNKKLLDKIKVENIDYVFVCHSHQDHEQHLPYLISHDKQFNGRIIMYKDNLPITKALLENSCKIHNSNVEYLHSKGYKYKPFYIQADSYNIMDYIDAYDLDILYKLSEEISFRFRSNSHVVGATQLELFITKPSGITKKILYTSDLGSPMNKKFKNFLTDNYIVSKANLVLIESTYGSDKKSFSKEDCIKERNELKDIIQKFVLNEKHNVLIPCFSYGRLQDFMVWLYENFKDTWDYSIPIIIGSKLGVTINNVYSHILKGDNLEYWNEVKNWKAFKIIQDYKSTISFLTSKQNALILSSSGMISGGNSVSYTKEILGNSNDCICFCGYCADNTIGGKILNENNKVVEIDGSIIKKNCTIKRFNTFSSHAQQQDLVNYIKQINCDKIVLQHGDKECKEELKEKLDDELSKINKTTKVIIANEDLQIKL